MSESTPKKYYFKNNSTNYNRTSSIYLSSQLSSLNFQNSFFLQSFFPQCPNQLPKNLISKATLQIIINPHQLSVFYLPTLLAQFPKMIFFIQEKEIPQCQNQLPKNIISKATLQIIINPHQHSILTLPTLLAQYPKSVFSPQKYLTDNISETSERIPWCQNQLPKNIISKISQPIVIDLHLYTYAPNPSRSISKIPFSTILFSPVSKSTSKKINFKNNFFPSVWIIFQKI